MQSRQARASVKNPRITDNKAVEIVDALGIDISKYDKFMSHEGVVARTVMLDRQLQEIIRKNPETVIINVGAGFDDRFSRVDNGKIIWFDLDLPDVITARKKAFSEKNRVTMIAGNILDSSGANLSGQPFQRKRQSPSFWLKVFSCI